MEDGAGEEVEELPGHILELFDGGFSEVKSHRDAIDGRLILESLLNDGVEFFGLEAIENRFREIIDGLNLRDHRMAPGLGEKGAVVPIREVLVVPAEVDDLDPLLPALGLEIFIPVHEVIQRSHELLHRVEGIPVFDFFYDDDDLGHKYPVKEFAPKGIRILVVWAMAKKKIQPKEITIRKARVSDLPRLVEVENACFDYDQLSRRNFHWMIKHAHSIFLVLEHNKSIAGYGLVLINKGTSLARLYSICVTSEYQGLGLAARLVSELEDKASEEDCAYLRLEVKESNTAAIKLYEKLGYKKFTKKVDYYDDGVAALCFEKQIRVLKTAARFKIPYYQQGTEFTCGPACLMMAMKSFDKKTPMTLSHELQIWREATTIFMTSGHGGCGPMGLALSAKLRGFKSELYLSHLGPIFKDSVRAAHKKEIVELVHNDFVKKVKEAKIKIHKKAITLADMKEIMKKGGVPIVLISTYHFDAHHAPHWVVVTAYDDHFIYLHDPDKTDLKDYENVISRVHIPVPEDQFLKISRWSKARVSATVVVYPRKRT